jgi:membrane-bound lytic murein transglycosylase D
VDIIADLSDGLMMKKLLLLMSFCSVISVGRADEISTNMMIMNNSNSQQFNDIWSRMRAGFKLDHTQSDRVKYFERVYTKNPKTFNKLMNNAIPYLYFLLNETERNGLPTELALVPAIESSYDPLAKNPTDAYAGMWQFVPSTGRRFFMAQDDDIDERRDIVKSTRSALKYFAYLHLMFKQWDVAIGAYNWGEGGMYRAILSSDMSLGNVTYSDLKLRQITADYVPKIVALASIIENPGKFGVTLNDAPNRPYFAIVAPQPSTTVSDVSKLSNVDKQVFTKLNAQYKDTDYKLTAKNNILLPETNQNVYYANIGKAVVVANEIQLASNDTVSQPMADSNLKPAALVTVTDGETANDNSDTALYASDINNMPAQVKTAGNTQADNSVAAVPVNNVSSGISAQDNQELDDLLAKIDTNKAVHTTIRATTSVTTTKVALFPKASKSGVVKYAVNQGDTLYSISKKFNADINQIRIDNHIPGNNLSAGQALMIKPNTATTVSTL